MFIYKICVHVFKLREVLHLISEEKPLACNLTLSEILLYVIN